MDYNSSAHLHANHTVMEDQKPNFHTSEPHHVNFHHRPHDHSSTLDTPPTTGSRGSASTSSRGHQSYDSFDSNQGVERSHFLNQSPGCSPGPISAAAEYLRHQELNRGAPRKRVYQDWNQVGIYNTPGEAEEGIKNFENCRWKVGNKFTSREGFKVYWSCREGANCPVQIHLLYHSQLPRVVLFRNQPPHHHTEKVKTRGLLPEVESLIRELFDTGVNKPRRIQFILQKRGMEEVPQTKLSNFLVKLRREAALNGSVSQKRAWPSYTIDDEDDEDQDGSDCYNQQDEKSSLSPSAMFPSVIMSTPSDQSGIQGYCQQSNPSIGQSQSVVFGGQGHSGLNETNSQHPGRAGSSSSSFSGRFSGVPGVKEGHADQSEVVTCSSSRRRSLYCRDETTEDGDNLLEHEENIKDLVLNHIRMNYSNRDLLHIREELRILKRENKYPALNRLLAFTAGFLQDTFIDRRDDISDSPNAGHEETEADI